MTYENSGQLDRALKKAVRDRGSDPGDGYRQALRDRFLCRVFSDPDGRFILKGGSGLLARIPDGRATRDIDFATASRESSEDALVFSTVSVDKIGVMISTLSAFCVPTAFPTSEICQA